MNEQKNTKLKNDYEQLDSEGKLLATWMLRTLYKTQEERNAIKQNASKQPKQPQKTA